MATALNGIMGPLSGRIGPVVGYMWKRTQCIRAYVAQIRYPNTEAQQQERDWFVSLVRFASQARRALKLGLARTAAEAGMTEGNLFVMRNKMHFERVDGQVNVNYSKLHIAHGSATDVYFREPCFGEHETVTVEFEKNSMSLRASGDDRVYLYIYAPGLEKGYLAAPALRRSKRVEVQLPAQWAGQEVHLYGFVVDREGRPSNSTYIGVGRVNHFEDRGRYIPLNKNWNDFVEMVSEASAEEEPQADPVTPTAESRTLLQDRVGDPPQVP